MEIVEGDLKTGIEEDLEEEDLEMAGMTEEENSVKEGIAKVDLAEVMIEDLLNVLNAKKKATCPGIALMKETMIEGREIKGKEEEIINLDPRSRRCLKMSVTIDLSNIEFIMYSY